MGEPWCPAWGTDASADTMRFSIWKVRTPKASLVGGISATAPARRRDWAVALDFPWQIVVLPAMLCQINCVNSKRGPPPRRNLHLLVPPPLDPFRTPKSAPGCIFGPPKSHVKFHSIFNSILTPRVLPKATQNRAKTNKKEV